MSERCACCGSLKPWSDGERRILLVEYREAALWANGQGLPHLEALLDRAADCLDPDVYPPIPKLEGR